MTVRKITNRDLLATAWTWYGDAGPGINDEVSPIDIDTRLTALEESGWKGVEFTHNDLQNLFRQMTPEELRNRLRGHGIEIVEFELLTDWWTTGGAREESDTIKRDLFDAAAALGVGTVKIGADIYKGAAPERSVSRDRFVASLNDLGAEAADRDLRLALEFMPMSNVDTVERAAELLQDIDHPNVGLTVDAWHVARGGSSYQSMVDSLDIDRVFIVELDDADAHVVGTLWEDTVDRRLMPGDGALDTAAFAAAMHDAGWRGHWGVEIISEKMRATPVGDATREAQAKASRILDAAEHVPSFTSTSR